MHPNRILPRSYASHDARPSLRHSLVDLEEMILVPKVECQWPRMTETLHSGIEKARIAQIGETDLAASIFLHATRRRCQRRRLHSCACRQNVQLLRPGQITVAYLEENFTRTNETGLLTRAIIDRVEIDLTKVSLDHTMRSVERIRCELTSLNRIHRRISSRFLPYLRDSSTASDRTV